MHRLEKEGSEAVLRADVEDPGVPKVVAEAVLDVTVGVKILRHRRLETGAHVEPRTVIADRHVFAADARRDVGHADLLFAHEFAKHVRDNVDGTVGKRFGEGELIPGAEAEASDHAVRVFDCRIDAAVRREVVALDAHDLQLCLRFNEQALRKIVLVAEFGAQAVIGLPEGGADVLSYRISRIVVAADTADLGVEVGVSATVREHGVVEIQAVTVIVSGSRDAVDVRVASGVVERNPDDLAAVGVGNVLVVPDLDHVLVHVEGVVHAHGGITVSSPDAVGASIGVTGLPATFVEAVKVAGERIGGESGRLQERSIFVDVTERLGEEPICFVIGIDFTLRAVVEGVKFVGAVRFAVRTRGEGGGARFNARKIQLVADVHLIEVGLGLVEGDKLVRSLVLYRSNLDEVARSVCGIGFLILFLRPPIQIHQERPASTVQIADVDC